MKQEGHLVLFSLPNTNFGDSKLRPALLIKKLFGTYDDWLVCMVTSRLHQEIKDFDEIIDESDSDYKSSGLK